MVLHLPVRRLVAADIASTAGGSPSKTLLMRAQCIEQLDKLERGGITQSQYSELQDKLMSDMRDM